MMWKHRLAYSFLWLASFLLYIFYVGYVSWLLFVLVCCLPIMSLIHVLIGKYRVSILLDMKQEMYYRNDGSILYVNTRTRFVLPLAKIQGKLRSYNTFTKKEEVSNLAFGSAHKLQSYEIERNLSSCGKYIFSLSNVKVIDALGLFSFRIKVNSEAYTYCLPNPRICEFPLPKVEQVAEVVYDPIKKGNDRSETFGVHSYQPGDAIHAIHWKLSAKMDDLMVREFSSPIQAMTSLSFDFYGSLLDSQEILASVYGSSLYLLSCGKTHEIIQFEAGAILIKRTIQNKLELHQCLCMILDHEAVFSETSSLPTYSTSGKQMFYVKKDGVQVQHSGGELHE